MEAGAQNTSWPGMTVPKERPIYERNLPRYTNEDMSCITGGVHIRLSAERAGTTRRVTAQQLPSRVYADNVYPAAFAAYPATVAPAGVRKMPI